MKSCCKPIGRNILLTLGIHLLVIFCFTDFCLAERLAVSAKKAKMRSGPGNQFEVLWEVEQYHPFEVVTKKGEWFRVRDYEKDEAWVHQSLLQKIDTVITSKDKCNIRSAPNGNADILFTTEKGIPFKVIARQGQWVQVEHTDGDKGWANLSLMW